MPRPAEESPAPPAFELWLFGAVTAKNVGRKAWKKEDMDALGTLNHEGI
jgi:hypothetical protein